jgi:hypothetical protein
MSPGDHCLEVRVQLPESESLGDIKPQTTPQHSRNAGTGVRNSDTIINDVIPRPTVANKKNDSESFLPPLISNKTKKSDGLFRVVHWRLITYE